MTDQVHETLTAAERDMLTGLGLNAADVTYEPEAYEQAVAPKQYSDDVEAVAADMLKRAHGNKEKAMEFSLAWLPAEHAKVKMSRQQGTALGINHSQHNKDRWGELKLVQDQIRAAIRRQAGANFVRTKIRNRNNAKEA